MPLLYEVEFDPISFFIFYFIFTFPIYFPEPVLMTYSVLRRLFVTKADV